MTVNFFRRDDRDTKFILFEQFGVDKLLSYEAFKDFSADDFHMIIQEALKTCREVVGPTLKIGDQQGCKYENNQVTTPKENRDLWKFLFENGWGAMPCEPEFGGQGLPLIMHVLVTEFFDSANMAFTVATGVTSGGGRVISNYGTAEDRALFVEKMYSGIWAGTMCLTEADAGSDVGWLRTKAIPDPDAGDPRIYKIQGTKRFISAGEHDLTENIIHLVLARIEGAPKGTKGISLFIVPKIWVNPDGSLGQPNDMNCTGIEHKMGLHGSVTASLSFGENNQCRGILLGEPNSGMSKMFQLMNEARIATGLQALGCTSAAYDVARVYAQERIQGPPFTNRSADRVPIIQHEDVRRMLMNLKSGTEAMRALLSKIAYLSDVAEHDPDEKARHAARRQVELLIPLVKSYNTDYGYQLIRDAIQIFGGSGYCAEYPVEQYARDIKILSIWEGTNYIQSLDLIGRKMMMEGGKIFQDWIQEIMDLTAAHRDDPDLAADFKRLFKAAKLVGEWAMQYVQYFQDGRLRLIPLTSTRFLDCMAEVEFARLLLEQALIARTKLADVGAGSADDMYYRGKIETAKYFCRNTLVNVFSRHMSLETEDTSALDIPEAAFNF
ncbi:MAG: acyl-CoA dehydrogenase [Deltaproteobacteria bacterium]|nr:acyl-CoA dehydrogenase [Deltaproteobacteria bacterium]